MRWRETDLLEQVLEEAETSGRQHVGGIWLIRRRCAGGTVRRNRRASSGIAGAWAIGDVGNAVVIARYNHGACLNSGDFRNLEGSNRLRTIVASRALIPPRPDSRQPQSMLR